MKIGDLVRHNDGHPQTFDNLLGIVIKEPHETGSSPYRLQKHVVVIHWINGDKYEIRPQTTEWADHVEVINESR